MALNAVLGNPNQNSYVTENEADAYFEDRAYTTSWAAFADKEPLLILCSRMIDWYINWKGFKKNSNQPMQWPRTEVILKDGSFVGDDELPQDVKTAVFELAISSLTEDRTEDDPLLGLEQLKISTLAIKAKPDRYGKTIPMVQTLPEKVKRILKELTSQSSFGVIRLIRG